MLRSGVRGLIASAAFGLAGVVSMTAGADGPPVDLGVNGNNQALVGTATNLPEVFNYQGSLLDAGGDWLVNWNFNASNNANGGTRAFTAGNFVIQNLSDSAIAFELTVSLATAISGTPWLYGGSVSGGLTTSGPGFITDNDGLPLWEGSTGNSVIATMFDAPFNVTRTDPGSSSLGSDSFGDPIPSLPGPDLGADLTITLRFILGANSSASFTSVFVAQVPAPGAMALLGLSGLVGLGRRRRA
jgi:uncharacterized protein (TIGR03382 family)